MSSSLSIDTEPYSTGIQYETMNEESWQLVTNEPVEFVNTTVVENIVKKNCSRLSIAVLLTTLICTH
jgi:hypothetical protein